MRNQLKTVYSALALVAMMGLTSTAYGVPAFARQTGLDCNSCHAATGFPTLNSFGQAFKAGGFSQGNDDDMLGDGEALSIPKSMNVSLVYKVRNEFKVARASTDAAGNDTSPTDDASEFQNPDELAILAGGRVAKNAGWLMELGNDGGMAKFASFKFVYAPELGPVRLGIVPWFSDLTPAYMFETLSTGAVRNNRIIEDRRLVSAMNAIGFGGANATDHVGLGAYVWHPIGFVAFTPFMNAEGPEWRTSEIGYLARLAVTPSFGNIELGVGLQYYFSTQGYESNETAVVDTTNFLDGAGARGSNMSILGIDAQAFMNIGIPLTIVATYALDMTESGETVPVSNSSMNFGAEVGIVPDVFAVAAGFGLTTLDVDGEQDTTMRVGGAVKYYINRNVKAEVDVTFKSNSNTVNDATSSEIMILPMIFAAF